MDPARDPGTDAGPAVATAAGRAKAHRRKERASPLSPRVRRWLRPPRRLRPTRAGWWFFLLTFGVGFAALNTGNNLLYMVLALMLAFLVLSGLLSEAALRGIRVKRRVPREVFAEQEARVCLEIANDQRRVAAFAIVVEDRVAETDQGDRPAGRCFALRIEPGDTETRSYPLLAQHRGLLEFRGFVVCTRFPFGLFSKSLVIEAERSVLVYPAVDPVPPSDTWGDAAKRGESQTRELAGSSAVAAGLRSYAPGDPRRRIHWRASLRTGSLLVRELESERDIEVEVRLRTGGTSPGGSFEGSVRRAASEVVSLLDAGRRVSLRAGDRHYEAGSGPAHRATLLAFLARVQPTASAAPAEAR